MNGCFSLVLHSHLPYVRKNGVWPVGEDWLYQVMSDTYLPLLGMLAQLQDEGLTSCMGITVTPVLCEQLTDPYIKERFIEYLKIMAEHTSGDIRDFEYFADDRRRALADAFLADYKRKLLAYRAIDGDMVGALASFERSGLVETIGSAATHGFLGGRADWHSVKRQVLIGLESHRRHLGLNPAGFWIPECAYREGLEDLLEAEGIRYILLDPTALDGLPPTYPYYVRSSRVVALARSERAHHNAWDEHGGYPTDGRYMDSAKYYENSGLHYWRVTGPDVPIADKEIYEPEPAKARALDHARHFIDDVADELSSSASPPVGADRANGITLPFVLASYDTEFFGHGWKEGVYWLEVTLRSLASSSDIQMTTPSGYLDENQPAGSATLAQTTWGTNKDDSTWVNPETAWMWYELGDAQGKLLELGGLRDRGGPAERFLAQAAREVLLLESSDWPYMVAKDRAKEYAIERFRAHLERFQDIARALETGELEDIESKLTEIEEVDNIFAQLDLDTVFGRGAPREEGK